VSEPAGANRPVDATVAKLEGAALGDPASVVCPLCQGVLTEVQPGAFEHFRCHVGHAFSMESLVREQGESMERALWAAVRALEESATLCKRVSLRETSDLRRRFEEKAATQTEHAERLRQILLHGSMLLPSDARGL